MIKKVALLSLLSLVTLPRCATNDGPASAPTMEGSNEEDGATRQRRAGDDDGVKKPGQGNETPGAAIMFFAGGDKGLVVTGIRWNQPVSSENPGADCELKARMPGVYNCVMKQGNEAIVLTLKEDDSAAPHHLVKITLDGKGAVNRDRWTTELVQVGYTVQSETKGKLGKTVLLSADQQTRADIVWVAGQSAVTISFKLAGPGRIQSDPKTVKTGPRRATRKAGR